MGKYYRTCEYCGANLDTYEICDCNDSKSWYVHHYGTLIDSYDTEICSNYISQKIYKYMDKLYIETWYNGILLLFHELFD